MIEPWMVTCSLLNWVPPPKMALISGVMMFVEIDATTAVKAAPMTTATARSSMFPRKRNSLNSLIMIPLLRLSGPRYGDGWFRI